MKDMHRHKKHEHFVKVVGIKKRQVADDDKGVDDWHRVSVPAVSLD